MRLLESESVRERRSGGTTMSLVVHAAIVMASVAAGARVAPPVRLVEVVDTLVYHPPVERPASRTPSTGSTATGGAPTTPTRTIPVPIGDIPIGIPDLQIDGPRVGPEVPVVFGGSGQGSATGGSGDGAYGALDPSGTWDAHTVEVPVVPDARNAQPSYPEMLRSAGIRGRVLAECSVDSTGLVRPGSLVIVSATHELFASSVRRTVPSFRFTPARVQGRQVAQRVRVPFEFEVR